MTNPSPARLTHSLDSQSIKYLTQFLFLLAINSNFHYLRTTRLEIQPLASKQAAMSSCFGHTMRLSLLYTFIDRSRFTTIFRINFVAVVKIKLDRSRKNSWCCCCCYEKQEGVSFYFLFIFDKKTSSFFFFC